MRRAVTLLSTLVLATTLLAVPGGFDAARAQNPQQQDGLNPMGAKPTADSVTRNSCSSRRTRSPAGSASRTGRPPI